MTDETNEQIQVVLETGCVRQLVHSLSRTDGAFEPALSCLGNLVSGTNEQTEMVLAAGFLDEVLKVFQRPQIQMSQSESMLLGFGKYFCWIGSSNSNAD